MLLLDADEEYPKEDKSALAEFPSKVELNQFDVILWGDVDPGSPKVAQHLKDVAEFVRGFSSPDDHVANRGGGFLMIAGERYSPGPTRMDHSGTFCPSSRPLRRRRRTWSGSRAIGRS